MVHRLFASQLCWLYASSSRVTWVIPSSMPQSRHPTSSSWSSSRNLKESLRSALEKLCGCMRMMWGGMAAFEHWIWSPSSIWLPWCFRWKTLSQRSRAYFQMRLPSISSGSQSVAPQGPFVALWTIQGGKRWDLRENSTNVMRFKVWKTIAMIRRPSTLGIMFRVVLLKSRPWSGPWSTLITWGAQRTSSMCESPYDPCRAAAGNTAVRVYWLHAWRQWQDSHERNFEHWVRDL